MLIFAAKFIVLFLERVVMMIGISQNSLNLTHICSIRQVINLISLSLCFMRVPIQKKEKGTEEKYDEELSQFFYSEIVQKLDIGCPLFEKNKNEFESIISEMRIFPSLPQVWKYWINYTFSHCQLLDLENVEVHQAHNILFESLIKVFDVMNRGNIPAENIIKCFSEFLTGLEKIGAKESAKALHDYVFISRHIALVTTCQTPYPKRLAHEYLTELLSSTLFSSLSLQGKLYFGQYRNDAQNPNIQDRIILKIITEAFVNSDFFDKSFDAKRETLSISSLSSVMEKKPLTSQMEFPSSDLHPLEVPSPPTVLYRSTTTISKPPQLPASDSDAYKTSGHKIPR